MSDEMTSYNYPEIIKRKTADLSKIVGLKLEKALVNYVSDEINVLYLKAEDRWFSAQPEIGGEILGFHERESAPQEEQTSEGTGVVRISLFNPFIGNRVVSARQIGEAWNGHGFELSFSGIMDQTLLVQSIHAGSEPDNFSDCLRLGIGNYVHSADRI
ncbi:hypothetical protein [Marinobacter sp. KMM 10035]|uniref:hypothetical protein n=1 Tax=Marinobacter sp. KMM 10035 TaxID=3134034 RepID=UPI003979DA7E